MGNTTVVKILSESNKNKLVEISGWVKTFRANRFIALNDGSCLENIQCVIDYENSSWSIGGVANDNLSLSYNLEQSEENNKTETATNTTTRTSTEFEIRTIQAAYTMGGMT